VARFFANGIADFEGKGRESVFGAVRVALLFVLIVSSLAHVFGDQDCFFFFLLLF